ncbi:MAG: hypothetical protein AB7L65_04705 [Hyphomonadaceae bacterium]
MSAGQIIFAAYHFGALATFAKLTFFDGAHYNWWNWILIVPINGFLSELWPLYWIVIRPYPM